MVTRFSVYVSLPLAFVCATNQCAAKQYPTPSIPEMLTASDLVVLGSVSEVPASGGALKTALSVERVLKGETPSAAAEIDLGESRRAVPALPRHGLFFFKVRNGRLCPTRPDLAFLPVPLADRQLRPQSGDVLSQVAASLASVYLLSPGMIQERQSGVISTLMLVRSASRQALETSDEQKWVAPGPLRQAEEVYRIATDELRSIPYDVRRGYLVEVLSSGWQFPQTAWAASSMIEAGDLSIASPLKSYLLHPPQGMSLTGLEIMLALQRSPPTEGLGPFADYLLASDDTHIRKGAVSALLSLPPDVEILNLKLALRDLNSDIREGAVSLACERIKNCGESWSGLNSPDNIPRMTAMWTKWKESNP